MLTSNNIITSILLVGGLGMTLAMVAPIHEAHADEMPDCEQAAAIAERSMDLPPGLLQAIGRIESGRYVHGQRVGWPLSVNAGGIGRQFSEHDEAVAYVRDQSASGQRLIDVGCFQIDLFFHPQAFTDRQDAFDPQQNAVAASHILQDLHARTGDWNQAIALYHSADPVRGALYLQAVLHSWAAGPESDAAVGTSSDRPDPFTILVSAQASAVMVWVPTGLQGRSMSRRSRLPSVITP